MTKRVPRIHGLAPGLLSRPFQRIKVDSRCRSGERRRLTIACKTMQRCNSQSEKCGVRLAGQTRAPKAMEPGSSPFGILGNTTTYYAMYSVVYHHARVEGRTAGLGQTGLHRENILSVLQNGTRLSSGASMITRSRLGHLSNSPYFHLFLRTTVSGAQPRQIYPSKLPIGRVYEEAAIVKADHRSANIQNPLTWDKCRMSRGDQKDHNELVKRHDLLWIGGDGQVQITRTQHEVGLSGTSQERFQ